MAHKLWEVRKKQSQRQMHFCMLSLLIGTFTWSSMMVVLGLLIALHRMIGLSLHVCFACLVACLCWRFRQKRSSPRDVTMPQVWCCIAVASPGQDIHAELRSC